MTLLVNEIFIRDAESESAIVFAADRRITANGQFHSERKKIFKIPYLNGGIGYFGLAQINQDTFFSEWIPSFIETHSDIPTLKAFAYELQRTLNKVVKREYLLRNPSGLHICGYNEENKPELWFVRNIRKMKGPLYLGFEDNYSVSEDFDSRDRIDMEKRIEISGQSGQYNQYYVNGDIRAFHSLWLILELGLMKMLQEPDFKSPQTRENLLKVAEFKMETISLLYENFADIQVIGKPIDSFLLIPEQNTD